MNEQNEEIKVITFRQPDRNQKGYARRQRDLIARQERLRKEQSVAAFDALVEYVLDNHVAEPTDRDGAREIILEMSEAEFDQMLAVLQGAATVPLASNGSSKAG